MALSRVTLNALNTVVVAALILVALMSAGLIIWLVALSRQWDSRIALAQESYSEHLLLESNLHRLFKEYADVLLIGDQDGSATTKLIESAISGNLDRIRTVISQEIEIVGEGEFEELQALAELERIVSSIKLRYLNLLSQFEVGSSLPKSALVSLLDRDVDQHFASIMENVLAGELAEVESARRDSEAIRDRVVTSSSIFSVLMVIFGIAIVLVYRRYATLPLQRLVKRADAYQKGDFGVAIPASGAAELRELASTLSEMARVIANRERDLKDQAKKLEKRVAERTSELQLLLAELEQNEARRRQMMADVSHELRTPLTIIQGEADVALRNQDGMTDQVVDSMSRIRDASRHTNRIVDDLLLVAREESGQLRLDLRNVDLDAALADACGMAPRPIELVPFGQPVPCRVDQLRFRQCILAVINNALRYGGKTITARIETGKEATDVLVEDDGPGMSAADKDQAFVRFFRGSGVSGSGAEGTGLGLPIVRSIMSAHGGFVDLLDREGGGLIVRLRFPRSLRPIASSSDKAHRKTA